MRARLLNVAQNRNLRYQLLLTRYLQERLIYRVSISKYKHHFILKGGALIYAYEGLEARPTMDVDFMGNNIAWDKDTLIEVFTEICSIPYPPDGVIFHPDTIRTSPIAVEKKYPGVNITMLATLHSIKQDVSFDIGFGDIVTPYPIEIDFPTILDDEEELPILAYSVETVIAEKFQAMIERGASNSRMKDFYDLFGILHRDIYNEEILAEAIRETFSNRHTYYTANHLFFSEEFPNNVDLNRRWGAYLRKLKPPHLHSFPEVASFIQISMKPYWERLR